MASREIRSATEMFSRFLTARLNYYVCIYVMLAGWAYSAVSDGSKALLPSEMEVLASEATAAQGRVNNLCIKAESWVETRTSLTDPNTRWEMTPIRTLCTVWLDAPGKVSRRVEMHEEVLRWSDGAAPYGHTAYAASFNGSEGRLVRYTLDPVSKAQSRAECIRQTMPPTELADGIVQAAAGMRYSTLYRLEGRGYTFADLLRLAGDEKSRVPGAFDFEWDDLAGVKCVKISMKTSGTMDSHWLDPARGFALLRYKNAALNSDGSERLLELIEIQELSQIADGIWWPIRAYSIRPSLLEEGTYVRTTYHAITVTANAPDISSRTFLVQFPQGGRVDDRIEERKYRVGEAN